MQSMQQILADNPLSLGPMAGVTDKTMRTLARSYGCGLVYTEMISAKAMTYGNEKTFALMDRHGEEEPVAVQLFGSEPEIMAEGARLAVARGAKIIDVNMGCPVPKVAGHGEGSALLLDPLRAQAIIASIADAVAVPVTAKIRIGWHDILPNLVDFAKGLQAQGLAALAVHGRTRSQYYSGQANWAAIKAVKDALEIPVIANGDVFTPEDALAIGQATGADGIMIGRGALGKPWLFRQVLDYLASDSYDPEPSAQERAQIALAHGAALVAAKGEYIAMREMRKHIGWYFKGLPHAARLREQTSSLHTQADLHNILSSFLHPQAGE